MRDNLTAPLEHGLKGLTFWLEHDSGWASYSDGEWWDHAASRAIGARLPDDDDIVPVDTVVARLREQIVQRLEVDEQLGLPEPSLQALDYFANDVADNDVDHAILTDALLMGYTLRIAERELLSATGFDDRTIARLRDAAADDLVAVIASLVSHAQHVADDLPTPFRQGASAWSTLSTWAGQRALDRDQARRNSGMETGGPPTISPDECERAFGLGYGIRYADEALDATLSSEAADTELSDFDPLDPTDVNVHDAAIDLLTRTEAIFVDLGAPAPLGLLITRALLMGRYHADESHPMYGALLAVTVFGYAMRMAQAEQAPLPEEEADSFDLWIERTDHGDADHQAMSDDPESLQELAIDAGELADDQLRLLTLLRVAVQVWEEFQRLATDQLHRNLRTNGLKRRLLPTAAVIENLICLGCAARVVDEVAGESPPSKSDLGLI